MTVIDWETACLADPSFIIGQWMGLEVRSPELAGDYQLLARAGRARLGDNYRPEVAETAARYKALTSLLFQVRTACVHSVPRREAWRGHATLRATVDKNNHVCYNQTRVQA